MGKRWTEAEDGSLRVMRAAGISYRECGKVLKRTEQACAQRGYNLDLTKKGSASLPIDEPVITYEEMYVPRPRPTLMRRLMRKLIGG